MSLRNWKCVCSPPLERKRERERGVKLCVFICLTWKSIAQEHTISCFDHQHHWSHAWAIIIANGPIVLPSVKTSSIMIHRTSSSSIEKSASNIRLWISLDPKKLEQPFGTIAMQKKQESKCMLSQSEQRATAIERSMVAAKFDSQSTQIGSEMQPLYFSFVHEAHLISQVFHFQLEPMVQVML